MYLQEFERKHTLRGGCIDDKWETTIANFAMFLLTVLLVS